MKKIYPKNKNLKKLIIDELDKFKIKPNKDLGQHFLIDKNIIDLLVNFVLPKTIVIEVGSGVGQLTEALAKKAFKIISIEIDERYRPILDKIEKNNQNLKIIYGNFLDLKIDSLIKDFKKYKIQIIANLPYHITEPFLHQMIKIPIKNAVLVVGKNLFEKIENKENDLSFGQLTLLTQTFFYHKLIKKIEKKAFFPIPKTDSVIIELTPKEKNKINDNKLNYLLKRLFITSKNSPLIKNCLMEGLIEFTKFSGQKLTKNQTRKIIAEMNIPQHILNKPFQQLNNRDLKILYQKLNTATSR